MSLAYRPDVDGLRAVAVGSVVLFHGHIPPFTGGFIGVDVFFVISGFLITSILARDIGAVRFSLYDFYDRRIRRIFPALFVVLAVTTALAALVLMPSQMVAFAKALPPSAFFFANIHFADSLGYFGPNAEEMPLLHLWSLAVEEQFYIIFPVLLFLLMRVGGKKVALGALVLIALGSLAYAQVQVEARPQQAFYLLSTRAWELLAGALLALAPLPRREGFRYARFAPVLGLLGLAGILAPVFLYNNEVPFPGLTALPPVLGAVAILLAGFYAPHGPVSRLLSTPGFVYIGRISYSLYLWHWPLLVLAALWKGAHLTYLQSGGVILLSIAFSALSLKYVETPFRNGGILGGRKLARFGAGAAVMAATVLLAFGLEARGAGVWRNTPLGTAAEAADGKISPFARSCHNAFATWSDKGFKPVSQCAIGPKAAEGQYDVVVWGDSHAGASFPAFAAAFERTGLTVRLQTMDGCPPLIGGEALRFSTVHEGRTCAAFNAAVLKEIAQIKPKLVIMVGRWSMWTRHGGRVWTLVTDELEGGRERTQENSRRVFAHMLDRTLGALDDMGEKVLLVGQVPEFGFNPARCVAHAEFFGRPSGRCIIQSSESAAAFVGEGNAMLATAQQRHPRSRVFIPLDAICADGQCRSSSGETFFYADRDHLSEAGARQLLNAPDLRAALADALRHDPVSSAALSAEAPAGGSTSH